MSSGTIGLEHSHGLKIHNFSGSWSQYYPVLSFMMNGQRMPKSLLSHCKTSLGALISSDAVNNDEDPLQAFSEGIKNFYNHYCKDDHSSKWCHQDKVNIIIYANFIKLWGNNCNGH